MKRILENRKTKTINNTSHLNNLILLIPLFLLSFALFITCIKLIQKETLVSSAFKHNTDDIKTACTQNGIMTSVQNKPSGTDGFTNNICIGAANIAKLQSSLSDNIIRLHVIANSDSDADQNLKYKVRNAVIEKLRLSLTNAKNMEEAETIIEDSLSGIEQTALQTVKDNSYGYSVNAKICNRNFPVKTYGDLTFPAGTYRALCIEIGKADGKNWWCVLFPSLCFVDSTTAVVPKESKELLRTEIGESDYLELQKYSSLMAETAEKTESSETAAGSECRKDSEEASGSEDRKDRDSAASSEVSEEDSLEIHSAIYDWIKSKLQ